MRRVTRFGSAGGGIALSVMTTSNGRREDIPQQGILALEFVDMISEEPGHPVRGSLGPTRLHVVHLVAQNALESGGQFADEFLEEPGDVGLKPAGRLVSASSEERSEENTSEIQSLMRISYAVFCLKKKKEHKVNT